MEEEIQTRMRGDLYDQVVTRGIPPAQEAEEVEAAEIEVVQVRALVMSLLKAMEMASRVRLLKLLSHQRRRRRSPLQVKAHHRPPAIALRTPTVRRTRTMMRALGP